jgi:SNF2 family DNA or RNA helicase
MPMARTQHRTGNFEARGKGEWRKQNTFGASRRKRTDMLKARKEPSLESKLQAFPYQVETVETIKCLSYAAIFHEQGLGKTKIAIDLALTWIRENALDSVLIVTKKSLIRNWQEEVASHSHLKVKTLDQDGRTLFYAFNSPARIYLTHYEVCKSCFKALELFLKTRRVGVICDESQKIKNPESALAGALHSLSKGFVKRVIMTGTPIANRPYDIWSQIWFLDQGESLGNDFKSFREKLDLPRNREQETTFFRELAKIYSQIESFSVRETKATCGIILPSKKIENLFTSFEPHQLTLYLKYKKELQAEVVRKGKLIIDDAESILKRLLRLVQIASNPRLIDESYMETPAKFASLIGLLDRINCEGSVDIVH